MSGERDWFGTAKRVLAQWAASGKYAAETARVAPLRRAMDCVDAADALVARFNAGVRLVERDDCEDIAALVAAYEKARISE